MVILLVVVAWLGMSAWHAAAAARLMQQGANHAESAGQAAGELQLDDARADLALASDAFDGAQARLSQWPLRPWRLVPGIRPNLSAAAALAGAGELAVAGSLAVVDGLREAGGLHALGPRDRALPVDRYAALAGPLADGEGLLRTALSRLDGAPRDGLVPRLAETRELATRQVERALAAVTPAARLAAALPAFLGAEGPRRYLVAAQNPAELRGTGGLVGAYALLVADQGRLRLGGFDSVHALGIADPRDLPAPDPSYAQRWNRFGGSGSWVNHNMTPDFPSAATALANLYGHATGTRVDGVVAVDPHGLRLLLTATGPVEAPAVGRVDADSVVDLVAREAYGDIPDPERRKRLLGAVAGVALDRFLAGQADLRASVDALAEAASGGHLLLHARDRRVQDALLAAGLAGALAQPDGDFLAVVGNNTAEHKGDFFTDREVRYDVTLRRDGAADAQATVRLDNATPTTGHPAYVIGPNRADLAAGDNRTLLSAYCAATCELREFRRERDGEPARFEHELGHPVASTSVTLASGAGEQVQFAWRVDRAWRRHADGDAVYRLVLHDQPTLRPTAYMIRVTLPDGAEVVDAGEAEVVDGGRVVQWRPRDPALRTTLTLRFRP